MGKVHTIEHWNGVKHILISLIDREMTKGLKHWSSHYLEHLSETDFRLMKKGITLRLTFYLIFNIQCYKHLQIFSLCFFQSVQLKAHLTMSNPILVLFRIWNSIVEWKKLKNKSESYWFNKWQCKESKYF